jgi:cell wall-associated NlpC family hydrolase
MTTSNGLDRRLNAVRDDLAAAHLKDIVSAPRYAEGFPARVVAGKAELHKGPDRDTPVDTELVYGDVVTVYDEAGNWAWVQNRRDGYVGYLPKGCLALQLVEPTHKVTALATFAYGRPDIKTPLPYKLYMNSPLAITGEAGKFYQLADGRYVAKRHVGKPDRFASDFVAVAECYAGVPYLWGGRTMDGIDCSGLVQVSMEAAGLACPRDSDMQPGVAGSDIDPSGMADPRRGDLVFWPGHVAIMLDETMLIHANAHHMEVRVEPLHVALYRIAEAGHDVSRIRRPAQLSVAPLAARHGDNEDDADDLENLFDLGGDGDEDVVG